MITLALALALPALLSSQQLDRTEDRRVEQSKGYHIVSHPARTGETPPDVKREKAEEDNNRRRRSDMEITDQTPPTRQPELKPKSIQPQN
jgi:hypothetical protein